MQREIAALALAFTSAFGVAHAQSEVNANWTRIWHASTGGLLTDTLTLAADTSELGGTVVLNMISRDGGQPGQL